MHAFKMTIKQWYWSVGMV